MTYAEYAFFRAAAKAMPVDELMVAVELARMADDGDAEAEKALRRMCLKALSEQAKPAPAKKTATA